MVSPKPLRNSSLLLVVILALALLASSQRCGDRRLNGNEQCDNGNSSITNPDGCLNNCTVDSRYRCTKNKNVASFCYPICGDGLVVGNEKARGFCDDGNTRRGDGCSEWCKVQAGWTCSGAPSRCRRYVPPPPIPVVCGDGRIGGSEFCDDGNLVDGDGCSATCQVEADFYCQGAPSDCGAAVCDQSILESGSLSNPPLRFQIQKFGSNSYLSDPSGTLVLASFNSNTYWQPILTSPMSGFLILKTRRSQKYLSINTDDELVLSQTGSRLAQQWCFQVLGDNSLIFNRKKNELFLTNSNANELTFGPLTSPGNHLFYVTEDD